MLCSFIIVACVGIEARVHRSVLAFPHGADGRSWDRAQGPGADLYIASGATTLHNTAQISVRFLAVLSAREVKLDR